MAPVPTYFRTWCKTCKDFTLHRTVKNSIGSCKTCDTEFSAANFSEIPEEKLLEQRKRYSDKKLEKNPLSLLLDSISKNPFSEKWPEPKIIEEDCGQKEIDDASSKRMRIYMEELRIKKHQQKEHEQKFKNINRNDMCLCGSGLKYKKCCLKNYKVN